MMREKILNAKKNDDPKKGAYQKKYSIFIEQEKTGC